jgi:predicted AlkP superfamily pyrophosphatase or phosphodiesterase
MPALAIAGAPLLPDYGGACLDGVVPALLHRDAGVPDWMPASVAGARQVVLLVIDGLGSLQLKERPALAPVLSSMPGGRITSVTPTTTATALTSITTGLTPAQHETVGYRVHVNGEVLNILRWRTAQGDARQFAPPDEFQTHAPFEGTRPPVITRAEFASSGFTMAHLAGVDLQGWRMPSTLVTLVERALRNGAPFVYAYYDGIDKVAHEYGFGPYYDAELVATDRLVGDVAAVLPDGAVLVVTADHGQVQVGDDVVALDADLLSDVTLISGEGRFRWLHARPGTIERLASACRERFPVQAWVRTVDELDDEGWFGGSLTAAGRARLGDVALIARAPVAFLDPGDAGENRLRCRHGSLTPDEVWVPLLAVTP